MARVNSSGYEFLKNMPSKNAQNFTALDRSKKNTTQNQRDVFVRIIDVERCDEERSITNDKTSLLMRSLKKSWDFTNAQPRTSRTNLAQSSAGPSTDDRQTSRRSAQTPVEDESVPATKHRKPN